MPGSNRKTVLLALWATDVSRKAEEMHHGSKKNLLQEVQLSSVTHEQVRVVVKDMEVDVTIQQIPPKDFHPSPKMQQKLRDMLWRHRQISNGSRLHKGI